MGKMIARYILMIIIILLSTFGISFSQIQERVGLQETNVITVANTTSPIPVVISDCNAATGWTVDSGTGTITADTTFKAEGTGSIRIHHTAGSGFTILFTGGPFDLSDKKYIKFYIYTPLSSASPTAYFGESAYTENSYGFKLGPMGSFSQIIWDISGIANSSKNAVTQFAIRFPAIGNFWVDWVRADTDVVGGIGAPVSFGFMCSKFTWTISAAADPTDPITAMVVDLYGGIESGTEDILDSYSFTGSAAAVTTMRHVVNKPTNHVYANLSSVAGTMTSILVRIACGGN